MKKYIWITPIIGFIYLCVCGIYNKHWFMKENEKNYHYAFLGLIIQTISVIGIIILTVKTLSL